MKTPAFFTQTIVNQPGCVAVVQTACKNALISSRRNMVCRCKADRELKGWNCNDDAAFALRFLNAVNAGVESLATSTCTATEAPMDSLCHYAKRPVAFLLS